MQFEDYQKKAHSTACYGKNIVYPIGALAEEAGEVAEVWTNWHETLGKPDSKSWNDIRVVLSDELGDVMWNIAELCTVLGLNMTRPEKEPEMARATMSLPYYLCKLNAAVAKLVGVYTKYVRKHDGVPPIVNEDIRPTSEDEKAFVAKTIDRLSDVTTCWFKCVKFLGLDVDAILEHNIEKLAARKKNNTLGGAGSVERK